MNRIPLQIAVLLLLALIPSSARAWGEHGHRLASEAATFHVPGELPGFFHRSYPQLIYMGYDPDRWRSSGPALDAVNPPNHFLDLEYVAHLELTSDRYEFLAALTESGTLHRLGISNTTSGFLPWKVAELTDLLTVQWRLWRASGGSSIERQQIENNIIAIAGELGHYVADAGNPHHATIHYNGWAAPQEEQFDCTGSGPSLRCRPLNPLAWDCGTHSRFESGFVSRELDLADVLPYVAPLRQREDVFAAIMSLIRESNGHVAQLYELDRAGGFDRAPSAASREFAASRVGAGASLLRDLWWSAWLASARPGPGRR